MVKELALLFIFLFGIDPIIPYKRHKTIAERQVGMEDRLKYIANNLKQRGYEEDDVIAILANMMVETQYTLDPSIKQGNQNISDEEWFKVVKGKGRGTGLFQWDDRRMDSLMADGKTKRKGLYQYAKERGTSWDDMDTQLDFLDMELNKYEKGRYKKAREYDDDDPSTASYEDRTIGFMQEVIRPGIPHAERRKEQARKLKKMFGEME